MRKQPTRSEKILWDAVRGRQLGGLKFRRQHVISPFVVDFYVPACRLVIEIDGPFHLAQKHADKEREEYLISMGYRILRFSASAVERELPVVLQRLEKYLTPRPPLHVMERGGGK